jgi:hypothetical protein
MPSRPDRLTNRRTPTPAARARGAAPQQPAVVPADGSDSLRFRAPTLDAAILLAEQALGTRVRVLAANRIRRGGIGGFFASDLGVEVTVTLDDESIEEALERLVAEAAADDRVDWYEPPTDRRDVVDRDDRIDPVDPLDIPAMVAGVVEPPTRRPEPEPVFARTTTTNAATESPAMVRMERILEELHALTESSPVAALTRRRAGLPPTSVAVRTPVPVEEPHAFDAARPTLRAEAEAHVAHDAADDELPVELAVSAADQLVDTLRAKHGATRVEVRVVLHLGAQRAVEATASWECEPAHAGR